MFTLEFKAVSGYAIFVDPRYIGWKDLDKIKEELNLKTPYDKILLSPNVNKKYTSLSVTVPDNLVKEISYFRARSRVEILVPESFLNRFIVWKAKSIFLTRKVMLENEIDKDKLISTWMEVGMPLNWNVDKKDLTSYLVYGISSRQPYIIQAESPVNNLPTSLLDVSNLRTIIPLDVNLLENTFVRIMHCKLATHMANLIVDIYKHPELHECKSVWSVLQKIRKIKAREKHNATD